jgi:hypothetical protein
MLNTAGLRSAPARFVAMVALAVAVLTAGAAISAAPSSAGLATQPNAPDVLVVHVEDDPNYLGELSAWVDALEATGSFGSVEMFYAGATTPTASDLAGIEVVIVTSNSDWADPDALGDVLAGFVDQGGRVIEMTFSFACTTDTSGPVGWGVGGRWEDEGYAAILPTEPLGSDCAQYFFYDAPLTMVVLDAASPFLAGVGSITTAGTFAGLNVGLRAAVGASLLATWSAPANVPLLAVGTNCVMGVNIWPAGPGLDADSQASVNQLIVNLATKPCGATPVTTSTTSTTSTTAATSNTIAPARGILVVPAFTG